MWWMPAAAGTLGSAGGAMRPFVLAFPMWVACAPDRPPPDSGTSPTLPPTEPTEEPPDAPPLPPHTPAPTGTVTTPPPPLTCGAQTNTAIVDGSLYFTDLQAAFDAAAATVVICPGTYAGPFVVTRDLVVESDAGAAGTVLDGGALGTTLTVQAASLFLDGVTVQGGSGVEGGGIHLDSVGGAYSIVNSAVVSNSAISGGGVWAADNATLDLTGTTISDCAAYDDGGGIFASALHLIGGTVSSNTAQSGGGIRLETTSQIEGTTIADNVADLEGGGVSVDGFVVYGASVTLVDALVSGNEALGDCDTQIGGIIDDSGGGGIHFRAQLGLLQLDGTTRISANSAPNGCGGGVFVASLSEVTGGEIDGNAAETGGGVALHRGADGSDVWVHDNSAGDGGGIAVIDTSNVARAIVENNTAERDGGGVFHVIGTFYGVGGADLIIEDSEFRANVAADEGGGLAVVSDDNDVFLKTSIVEDNQATFGGGLAARIFLDGGFSFPFFPGVVDVETTSLLRNVATVAGGGAYVGGTFLGGDLESDASEWGDAADDNVPDDVAVDDESVIRSYGGYTSNETFACDEIACIPGTEVGCIGVGAQWEDADGDGWGNPLVYVVDCEEQPGYVELDGDCDDLDPTIFPGAVESCGSDKDCDGAFPAFVFGLKRTVETGLFPDPIRLADPDADGDLDVAWADYIPDDVGWTENLGSGTFGAEHLWSDTIGGPEDFRVVDLDGDALPDVVATFRDVDSVKWFPNLGGGSFGAAIDISNSVDMAFSLITSDIDGDLDEDVVVTSIGTAEILWFENLGAGAFGAATLLAALESGGFIEAADVDQDADQDIVSLSYSDILARSVLGWVENLGGGAFGAHQVIDDTLAEAAQLEVADSDLDGDPDVFVHDRTAETITLYDNVGGSFAAAQIVVNFPTCCQSLDIADLDQDGDLDLVHVSTDDVVVWNANLGGGVFGPLHGAAQQVSLLNASVGDVDGDGLLDAVVAAVSRIDWYAKQACP